MGSPTPSWPPQQQGQAVAAAGRERIYLSFILLLALLAPSLLQLLHVPLSHSSLSSSPRTTTTGERIWNESVAKCRLLNVLPGPAEGFEQRTESDRFVEGTPAYLIQNATIWTGDLPSNQSAKSGTFTFRGDVLIDRGLIVKILSYDALEEGKETDLWKGTVVPSNLERVDAKGAWLTPGIFDMHSHIGVESSPLLSGASDGNSLKNPILPYLRSLDSINSHDASFKRSVSGGVTTSLILPGSANNIGGQAFVVKLRATLAKTPDSLVLELPFNIPQNATLTSTIPRWRHVKMACGENIRRVYKSTRMDLSWNFRSSFDKARVIKENQDEWCEKALGSSASSRSISAWSWWGRSGDKRDGGLALREELGKFPEELEWELLVDVLRGKVKVNTHCYESTDLAAFVRHTQEFKFPLAAFHHAHETYLVPDLLKSAWGGTPAVAIFATNARYKREAWRGSEYAARILDDANITVIMKSDHPVLDSRYLLFEAQQAHHFGLSEHKALSAITTAPARIAGFDHRIGHLRKNYDADLVLWDSHPLSLGATPRQVFIDGIPQLDKPFEAKALDTETVAPKIASVPKSPITLEEDDDSYRERKQVKVVDEVIFDNVAEVLLKDTKGLESLGIGLTSPFSVHVIGSRIECIGTCPSPSSSIRHIDLQGGSLLPPLTIIGPALGLTDIISESTASDSAVFDPLITGELSASQQIWGPKIAVKAIDGLAFGGKNLRLAERSGVRKAVTAPAGDGFFRGVSVAFRTGADNVLEPHAIIKDVVSLHISLGHYKGSQTPSISTQIAELRSLLLSGLEDSKSTPTIGSPQDYFKLAGRGEIPLVVAVSKADIIGTLIKLKEEVESVREFKETGHKLRWIIHGGQEGHLVADELAKANIGVILTPPSFPGTWDERRAIPGPPLTQRNSVAVLHEAGVLVALGVPEEWQNQSLLWEAAWAAKVSNGVIGRKEAIAWLSSNLDQMLDLPSVDQEFVAWERDPFNFGSRAIAASAPGGGIELWE